MVTLIQSEWLKLRKRPLASMLLVLFLVIMVLQSLQYVLVLNLGASALTPAQIEDIERRLRFPGAFGAVFGHINGLGGVFAVVLAAALFGGDYTWNTLRTFLPRHPNRVGYLLAKLAALLLGLLLAMVATLVVGTVSAIGFGTLVGGAGTPDTASLLALPLAMIRALLVLLPYVLLTVAATVYSRSLIVGLVGGLLFHFVDIAFGALTTFAELGGVWQLVYNLLVQANINTLVYLNSSSFGLRQEAIDINFDPALLPSPLQALVVIGVYCMLFLTLAVWSFRRRDV